MFEWLGMKSSVKEGQLRCIYLARADAELGN